MLVRKHTRQFMMRHYKGRQRADGTVYSKHPLAVALLAEQWGKQYFRQGRLLLPMDRDAIEGMWHAGALHDTMCDSNATWDDIVYLTDLEVAELVAVLSHDNRLSQPRRQREYANRLYHASPSAQIIKLADLGCALRDAITLLGQAVKSDALPLSSWPVDVAVYLQAIEAAFPVRLNEEWCWCQRANKRVSQAIQHDSYRKHILGALHDWPASP